MFLLFSRPCERSRFDVRTWFAHDIRRPCGYVVRACGRCAAAAPDATSDVLPPACVAPAADTFAVLSICALSRALASSSMSLAVPPGNPFSNCQISQRCENPSSPVTAAFSANSGSKIIRPCRCGARKLLRGMPNFCGRSVRICAIGFIFMRAIVPHCGRNFAVKRCAGVRSLLKCPFGINQGRHV